MRTEANDLYAFVKYSQYALTLVVLGGWGLSHATQNFVKSALIIQITLFNAALAMTKYLNLKFKK